MTVPLSKSCVGQFRVIGSFGLKKSNGEMLSALAGGAGLSLITTLLITNLSDPSALPEALKRVA